MNQRDKSALVSVYHSRPRFLLICITVFVETMGGGDHRLQLTSDIETWVLVAPSRIEYMAARPSRCGSAPLPRSRAVAAG
jgi:membrane associated rhomboid family serine protease